MNQHTVCKIIGAFAGAGLLILVGVTSPAATPGQASWSFEGQPIDAPPSGFSFARTGEGRPGRWTIIEEKRAPSGDAVLAQTDTDDTDYRFPLAIAPTVELKDLRLGVKCKPVEGKVDQACGLVFRYKDENRYYVARLNALENNVRLYHVLDGRRIQFAGWNGKVAKNVWHDLAIEVRRDKFQVFFDGKRVIEASDGSIGEAGKVGLWTKADSVTYFDDLNASPLE
jgi:hypothetical protein